MEKALGKITRENHLNSLLGGLPLLTTLYGINCILMYHFMEGIDISNFSLSLGVMLVSFVSALFIYDKYHHVLLYKDYILIYFQPLAMAKKIHYTQIQDIITPEAAYRHAVNQEAFKQYL